MSDCSCRSSQYGWTGLSMHCEWASTPLSTHSRSCSVDRADTCLNAPAAFVDCARNKQSRVGPPCSIHRCPALTCLQLYRALRPHPCVCPPRHVLLAAVKSALQSLDLQPAAHSISTNSCAVVTRKGHYANVCWGLYVQHLHKTSSRQTSACYHADTACRLTHAFPLPQLI